MTRRRHVQLSSVMRHFSRAAREHENFRGTLFLATDAGFQGQQCSCDTQENSSASLRTPSALSWASSLCSSTSEIPKERIPSSQLVTIRYWVFLAASALHQALQRHFALLWTVVLDWGRNHDLIQQIGLWDWFHSKEMAGAPGNLVVLSKKWFWIQLQGKEPPMSAFPSTPKPCPYAKENRACLWLLQPQDFSPTAHCWQDLLPSYSKHSSVMELFYLTNYLFTICFLNTSCLPPEKIQGSPYRSTFSTL